MSEAPRTWLWPLAYLATPYSLYPAGLDAAYEDACALAGRLLQINVKTYSPIAHSHGLARHAGLDPLAHDFWMDFDRAMMARLDVLLVAHLPSWEASRGIAAEIAFFAAAGKPVFDLDPDTLSLMRRK